MSASVYYETWWIKLMSKPNHFEIIEFNDDNGLICYFPYVLYEKRLFFQTHTIISMPKFTQCLGPYINKTTIKWSEYKKIVNYIIDNLPKHSYFDMRFNTVITDWLPWYWRGYKQKTLYTFQIKLNNSIECIFDNFKPRTKNEIRYALKNNYNVLHFQSIDDIYPLIEMTYLKQNLNVPYSKDFLSAIHNECIKHESINILLIEDENGVKQAGAVLIFNKYSTINLITAKNYFYNNRGVTELLIYESIKFASNKSQVFDFEGSMIESINDFYRSFSPELIPYFEITKYNNRFFYFVTMLFSFTKHLYKNLTNKIVNL